MQGYSEDNTGRGFTLEYLIIFKTVNYMRIEIIGLVRKVSGFKSLSSNLDEGINNSKAYKESPFCLPLIHHNVLRKWSIYVQGLYNGWYSRDI